MAFSLFGTDGIRGKVNTFPMTTENVMQVGKALAKVLGATGHGSVKVVIGKDTRLSGYMFESALEAGLVSMGADVLLTGPVPTPVLAWLIKIIKADAGIMITASHNPSGDNGLKIFNHEGFKLTDEQQRDIEELVLQGEMSSGYIAANLIGKTQRLEMKVHEYIDYAKSTLRQSLKGLQIVLDTAHGAAYNIALQLFEELGVEIVYCRGDKPDGDNINKDVGVGAIETLKPFIEKYNADLAVVLDGDADRVLFLDEKGDLVDGDHIIAMLTVYFKEQGKLSNNSVVVTEMTNTGMLNYLQGQKVRVFMSSVGDRHVLEIMRKENCNLGGEQSGHIIFLDHVTTGDGLMTALQIMAIMVSKQRQLSELTAGILLYKQILRNYKVSEALSMNELIIGWSDRRQELIDEYLHGDGRIFVRLSGTETNVLRVLVEGEHEVNIEECLEEITRILKCSGFLTE